MSLAEIAKSHALYSCVQEAGDNIFCLKGITSSQGQVRISFNDLLLHFFMKVIVWCYKKHDIKLYMITEHDICREVLQFVLISNYNSYFLSLVTLIHRIDESLTCGTSCI